MLAPKIPISGFEQDLQFSDITLCNKQHANFKILTNFQALGEQSKLKKLLN